MNFDWFTLSYQVVGGLSVFLFGMKTLSESLQALASDWIRRAIGWLTTNRVTAVLVGTAVTMVIQSSSVTTVMVVGFVNAGLMSLSQAIGVILGANIGTTVTGWLVALKIGKYGLVFLAAGLLPFFFGKRPLLKNIGKISNALGFVFLGLDFMSSGFKPLTKDPAFAEVLTFFAADNLLSVCACVGVGCLLTFIVQSSSAMLGTTIALATTAAPGGQPIIGLSTAVALVLGENIGTTITAQLAAIGGNIHAKRAAMAHTVFNAIGVSVMVLLFRPYLAFIEHVVGPAFDSLSGLFKGGAAQKSLVVVGFKIAAAHSVFNVAAVLFLLPFIQHLVWVTEKLVRDTGRRAKVRLKVLGDPSQMSPELALRQAEAELALAYNVTAKVFDKTAKLLEGGEGSDELKAEIDHSEGVTDKIQKEITIFLTTVLQMAVTPLQASRAYSLLCLAEEMESVADYCQLLASHQLKLHEHQNQLSESARGELGSLVAGTRTLFARVTERVQQPGSRVEVQDLVELGAALGEQADATRAAHLERIKQRECDALAGLTFSDMIVALRRLKNHSINMLEARNNEWESRLSALEVLDVAATSRPAPTA